MGKFCTSCGTALSEGAKFCAKCGANAAPVPEESGARSEQAVPKHGDVLTKVEKQIKNEVKTKASAYAQSVLSNRVPAFQSAGELALPSELSPNLGDFTGEGMLSLLKSGFKGLAGGFKKTLGDKKRLVVVVALAVVWLLVNLLAAFDIFPFPVRILSWLTAARGSLIGGSIGKGLVAALFAQVIADKGILKSLKSGMSQLVSSTKSGKQAFAPLLMGAGVALLVCNIMVSSTLQNTMVCIAGFALSAKALTQNGFLRRLTSALLPKANGSAVTALMSGWTLGFAAFTAVSLLPGGGNGYLLGLLLLIAGIILLAVGKNKKEVSPQ
jgi:hypothetical protein